MMCLLVSSRLESTGKSRCMSLLLVPAILRFGIGFLDPVEVVQVRKVMNQERTFG